MFSSITKIFLNTLTKENLSLSHSEIKSVNTLQLQMNTRCYEGMRYVVFMLANTELRYIRQTEVLATILDSMSKK